MEISIQGLKKYCVVKRRWVIHGASDFSSADRCYSQIITLNTQRTHMQWHTWSAGVQSDEGWGHFLENKRVMSLRYYDYSARSAESCTVWRRSSVFFYWTCLGKKDARHIRRHTCRQRVKQSQDETRHPLPSSRLWFRSLRETQTTWEKFAIWQQLRRQPIYRWEQLFPPLGLISRCNFFSLFTCWPKLVCCACATAEELKCLDMRIEIPFIY